MILDDENAADTTQNAEAVAEIVDPWDENKDNLWSNNDQIVSDQGEVVRLIDISGVNICPDFRKLSPELRPEFFPLRKIAKKVRFVFLMKS